MNIATKTGMKAAIEWQTNMLATIKDGGVWAVPRSMTLITIRHSKKTAEFSDMRHEPDIVKVFKAMGWVCVDGSTRN